MVDQSTASAPPQKDRIPAVPSYTEVMESADASSVQPSPGGASLYPVVPAEPEPLHSGKYLLS